MIRKITYAGRFERLFANIIDTLALFVPASIVAVMMSSNTTDGEPVVAPISMVIIFLINMAYYVGFTSGPWQATPGKRLLNMYVMHTDHSKLTQRDALERFLAYVLPSLPMYSSFIPENLSAMAVIWLSIFWFAPILTHPQRMGMHDKLCRTLVVAGKPDA